MKRGTTTAGLKFRDGVVLVCDKRIASRLIIPESIEKMFKIDGHVGIATSGLVADARQLVARARVAAFGFAFARVFALSSCPLLRFSMTR